MTLARLLKIRLPYIIICTIIVFGFYSCNGNDIAGTCLSRLSEEALKYLDEADLILSKGQANFETLRGCGKNIYYIFLCKCDMFANRFGVEKYTGMFLNDKDYIRMMDGKKNESND